jgi:ABC-type iron transport system FetAB ATPase subunit
MGCLSGIGSFGLTSVGDPIVSKVAGMDGLSVENLRFHGMGPISLRIGPGRCVGLSGPSGSGKTQLLRAIADLIPHTGDIALNGVGAKTIPAHEWRKKVGFLPAESAWWGETVGDHFSAIDTERFRFLGFDPDVLAWEVSRLSSGERQRLSLLRLLAGRPEALLLDEPTANLDDGNTARVEALVESHRLAQKAPVIWVGHAPDQIQRVASDRFRVHNGNLIQLA